MTEELKLMAMRGLLMNPDHLKPVDIVELPTESMAELDKIVAAKQCYRNAFYVASLYRMDVVLGTAILMDVGGIPIEHAWVAEPGEAGRHYDPTMQKVAGHITGTKYLELHRIPIDEYCATMDEMRTHGLAIDVHHLRHHKPTSHLFMQARRVFPQLFESTKETA